MDIALGSKYIVVQWYTPAQAVHLKLPDNHDYDR